jgi:acyl-CoA reductase-like NAD-dependent aldehyde dehydrogenase
VNVITGGGSSVGEELASHADVDKVAFTGSTVVGRRIMQLASSTVKKVTLELGGKSPNIVFDDADMEQAVDGALWATFFHQGQVCESGTRLLVPESIHDEFVERLVERAKQIKVGDPMDYESDLGPLVSAGQRETVENYVRIGKEEGAKIALGGKRPEGDGFERGYWYEPTIFTEVDNSMTIAQEEIFGPVLSVIKFKDDDDAVRIANDSIYGLASGIWSQDPDRCLTTAKRLRAGTVWINDFHLINCIAPFGGYKQSGVGRELGTYGLNEYTEVKHVHWDLGTPKYQKLFGVLISE